MDENISYVIVFPNEFSKKNIPQLITNIKKILKIKNQQFNSVKRDNDVILVDAHDPVFSSSEINLLFGIKMVTIARKTKNNFKDIVSEISTIGGNLLLKGEKFLVKVEGKSKGFFLKDVELAATSAIIEKKSNIDAKPGTEENYDKLLYTYLTKDNAYVCIFLDYGHGGIPFNNSKKDTICAVYDEISAASCFETIRQGFNPKIIVCYQKKSELTNLAKMINRIIPRLLEKKVEIEFFEVKVAGSGIKNYLSFVNTVIELMLRLSKDKFSYVSLPVSSQIFTVDFVDNCKRNVFENKMIPLTPISGIDSNLFDDINEVGMERQIPKIRKQISKRSDFIPKISSKIIDEALKSAKQVNVKIGPNNVHDILDSL